MRKLLTLGILPVIFLTHNLSFAQPKNSSAKLETTSANLLIISLQLDESANKLYIIKDNLVKIVQTNSGNINIQNYIMNVVSELKHIATIAYFESKLLGAVLFVREKFELPFVNARIPELNESIRTTNSSLQPLQVAYSRIKNKEALQQIDKAQGILQSLNQLYVTGIETLKIISMKRGEGAKKTKP